MSRRGRNNLTEESIFFVTTTIVKFTNVLAASAAFGNFHTDSVGMDKIKLYTQQSG